MHTITDKVPGGHRFAVDTYLSGLIAGDALVPSGRRVIIAGMVAGDLEVEPGSSVEINGMVTGAVRNAGGQVVVRGMVGAVKDSGPIATLVEAGAVITGRA